MEDLAALTTLYYLISLNLKRRDKEGNFTLTLQHYRFSF